MKFLTVEIDHVKNPTYERLLNAWEKSVQANAPQSDYERKYLHPNLYPDCKHPKNSYMTNSIKLNYWNDKVKHENQDLCLIDGDTVVLKDVSHVFDQDFDIAFTQRSKGIHIPINGGVLFLRPSKAVEEFMHYWVLTNNEMLRNNILHRIWYRKYNGINQASFGYMLENISKLKHKLKIISLPCSKYNACDKPDWIGINEDTHILHVKSELRLACINGVQLKQYKKAIDTWKKYDY